MISTHDWAQALDVPVDDNPPPIEGIEEPYPRTIHDIAVRALIVQGVVAVACGVNPTPVVDWFHDQHLWQDVTAREKAFLLAPSRSSDECARFGWQQEAEWTLLWMIGKVETLGLPIRTCDTKKLVDEIIPPLGDDIDDFLASAVLRDPGMLAGEDLRTYDLWCYAHGDRRHSRPLPDDLNWSVLYERRYAFEWLDSEDDWDTIICDA